MVLFLNDIGGGEVMLILAFILIFFGSKSIPSLARTLGKTMRQVKDASAELQNEIRKSGGDFKKDLNLKGILEETAEDIKRPLDQYAQDIDHVVKYQAPRNSHITPSPPQSPQVPKDSEIQPSAGEELPGDTLPEKNA